MPKEARAAFAKQGNPGGRWIAKPDGSSRLVINADPAIFRRGDILPAILGVGKLAVRAMPMPELGTPSRKEVASLAGPASMTRQSGKWRGKEHTSATAAKLRRAASTCPPPL